MKPPPDAYKTDYLSTLSGRSSTFGTKSKRFIIDKEAKAVPSA